MTQQSRLGAQLHLAPERQVRTRLAAGAEWIRTSGSARECLPFRFVYLTETVGISSEGLAGVRDRNFESTSLQRRVHKLSVPVRIPIMSAGHSPNHQFASRGTEPHLASANGRATLAALA